MDAKTWNHKIKEAGGSFLQSWEWGKFQESLGTKVEFLDGPDFAALLIRRDFPMGLSYFYAQHGPSLGKPGAFEKFLEETRAVFKNNRPAFLRLEPRGKEKLDAENLRAKGLLTASGKSVQPASTLILELSKSEEELLSEMEYETKYSIRTAQKRGVAIKRSGSPAGSDYFEIFWKLYEETNARHELRSHPRNYYQELLKIHGDLATEVFIAEVERRPVAAAVIAYFNGSAYYLYAASLPGFGRYNAPTFLLWEAIRDAKRKGFKSFDFWGISHENKSWQGITKFKKSFGGYEVDFPGTWDYPLAPLRYRFYRLIKTIL